MKNSFRKNVFHDFFFSVPPLISNVRGAFEITDIRDLVSITTGAVVTIPRGVSVRIKCIATGVPTPNITWYRRVENSQERSLLLPNQNMKIMKDSSLLITHTVVVDAAYYTCVATNIAGQDEGTTHLNIGSKESQLCNILLLSLIFYFFCRDIKTFLSFLVLGGSINQCISSKFKTHFLFN